MIFLTAVLMLLLSVTGFAQESYSPYSGQYYPQTVYWGDTHLHTNLSGDAYVFGNTILSPDDAYLLAKGKTITPHNGMQVRLGRPLDFLVVADHSENLGFMPRLEKVDPLLLNSEIGRRWYEVISKYPIKTDKILSENSETDFNKALKFIYDGGPNGFFWTAGGHHLANEEFRRSVWAEVTANAERHYAPGKFTAFIGYEWTSRGTVGPDGAGNLHRVVIFRDGPDKAKQMLPYTNIDSLAPRDLWAYLSRYEQKTGGQVLAIPHNGNLSNGEMFALKDFEGNPLTRNYAETRSRWEPIYEVTQIKGDGETHPILSPTDEFADYETWTSWAGGNPKEIGSEEQKIRRASEYARSALRLGLDQQSKLGVNPFKFGMIGSTDAHTSLSAVEENNFWGKLSFLEPNPYRLLKHEDGQTLVRSKHTASGYAAIWATENTREALFDAMKRKETYATTGPRIAVRFFGGWNFDKNDAFKSELVKTGYTKGVPMGGDLTNAPKGKTPSFLIRVVKDPDGANLDRVQVIKGWHSHDGELHEKIYNVALSDGRIEDENGNVPPVGNTVNVADASYRNTIGDPELAVVWTDPDFNPEELAFYYARVIEIPTPRWTAYDAKYFGLTDIPDEVPMITQERAYTSPIWYTP